MYLQATFDKFDTDRSGTIDASELKQALLSMGYGVSPTILDLLVSKYDTNGKKNAINYDAFIEYVISNFILIAGQYSKRKLSWFGLLKRSYLKTWSWVLE